jgi:hypothetical protein
VAVLDTWGSALDSALELRFASVEDFYKHQRKILTKKAN